MPAARLPAALVHRDQGGGAEFVRNRTDNAALLQSDGDTPKPPSPNVVAVQSSCVSHAGAFLFGLGRNTPASKGLGALGNAVFYAHQPHAGRME
jgi:hypothetical protein